MNYFYRPITCLDRLQKLINIEWLANSVFHHLGCGTINHSLSERKCAGTRTPNSPKKMWGHSVFHVETIHTPQETKTVAIICRNQHLVMHGLHGCHYRKGELTQMEEGMQKLVVLIRTLIALIAETPACCVALSKTTLSFPGLASLVTPWWGRNHVEPGTGISTAGATSACPSESNLTNSPSILMSCHFGRVSVTDCLTAEKLQICYQEMLDTDLFRE